MYDDTKTCSNCMKKVSCYASVCPYCRTNFAEARQQSIDEIGEFIGIVCHFLGVGGVCAVIISAIISINFSTDPWITLISALAIYYTGKLIVHIITMSKIKAIAKAKEHKKQIEDAINEQKFKEEEHQQKLKDEAYCDKMQEYLDRVSVAMEELDEALKNPKLLSVLQKYSRKSRGFVVVSGYWPYHLLKNELGDKNGVFIMSPDSWKEDNCPVRHGFFIIMTEGIERFIFADTNFERAFLRFKSSLSARISDEDIDTIKGIIENIPIIKFPDDPMPKE